MPNSLDVIKKHMLTPEDRAAEKRRQKRKDLQKIILRTVAAVGLISVAVLAPNALQALDVLGSRKNKRQKEYLTRSAEKLIRHGFLEETDENTLRLTKKGEVKLHVLELKDFEFKKPRRWDGKWRILVFDINEHKKSLRDKIRSTLATIGFIHLQHSVWVFPYSCEDLITLLKTDFEVGGDLLYITADSIENDHFLRSYFELPKAKA